MKISEKELQGLIPNIRGLVDPKVETRINEAFRRVYEFMLIKMDEQGKSYQEKITKLEESAGVAVQQLNTLVGAYSQPLIGGTPDPLLQTFAGQFGPQNPKHFLGGPNPSFREITTADITTAAAGLPPPVQAPADKLNSDGAILDVNVINNGEFLKRVGSTVVSAPVVQGPATQLDADGTILDVNTITDGLVLRRIGNTVVGVNPTDYVYKPFSALVGRSTARSLPNNAWTAIEMDTIIFDPNAMRGGAGFTYALVCPSSGNYLARVHVVLPPITVTGVYVGVGKNSNFGSPLFATLYPVSASYVDVNIAAVVSLVAGDYVHAQIGNYTGAYTIPFGGNYPEFAVSKIV